MKLSIMIRCCTSFNRVYYFRFEQLLYSENVIWNYLYLLFTFQDKSLETIEAMVLKFYRNARDIHKKNKANKDVTHTNKNPNKKKVDGKVRKLLENRFDKELDFYNFCVQRLQKQWKNVRSISKYNDDSEWPSQLTNNVTDETFVMLASN